MYLANWKNYDINTGLSEHDLRKWPMPMTERLDALRREALTHQALLRGRRILAVQNDVDLAGRLREALRQQQGHRPAPKVEIVPTMEAAAGAVPQGGFDACLVDWITDSSEDAAFLVRAVERLELDIPVIGLTRRSQPGYEREALDLGLCDVIDLEDLDIRRLERAIRLAGHRRRVNLHLDRMAHLDPLTGLGNRTFLHDRLERAIAQARHQRSEVAVMMLDLNGFKAINDGLGHAAGDTLLCAMSERFKVRLRAGDTIARRGGDEFAFVIEGLHNVGDADAVARRLLNAITPPFAIEGREVQVSGSLGVARFPHDAPDAAGLLRLADGAMYAAKTDRASAPRFHDSAILERGHARPQVTTELGALLRDGRIDLLFEPQSPLASDRIGVGIALKTPDAMPAFGQGSLQALAEEPGVCEQLTRWVLEKLCLQARAWQKLYPTPFHVGLPLIARRQLLWPDLAATLQDELHRHGLPRTILELEIEERLLQEQLTEGGSALETLRRAGIRLAVGDFGRAIGSLRLLREAPLDTVKLSAALIKPITEDEGFARLTRGLLHLAHDLRLRVVADGASTREQMAFLRNIGCDAVQRTPLTRLLSASDCTQWLEGHLTRPRRLPD